MRTYVDCLPCFVRQTLDTVRMIAPGDDAVAETILRRVLGELAAMDMSHSPPAMAQRVHRIIRESTGVADPYLDAKVRFNELALGVYPELAAHVAAAADPLAAAVRLVVAGNVIDMGVNNHLTDEAVGEALAGALEAPLQGDTAALAEAIDDAGSILYLADNAGEIVLDRLLVELLPADKVTLAVKGGPILNDALVADAEAAGLTGLVEVIDNGSDAPGTILDDCSPAFRRRFETADVVISKGQGNYETLNDVDKDIFFILKVKCPVIAADLGSSMGELILRRSEAPTRGGEHHA